MGCQMGTGRLLLLSLPCCPFAARDRGSGQNASNGPNGPNGLNGPNGPNGPPLIPERNLEVVQCNAQRLPDS